MLAIPVGTIAQNFAQSAINTMRFGNSEPR
jgi:hypothetical protein